MTISASTTQPTLTVTVSGTAMSGGGYQFAGGVDGNWYTDLTVVPRMNRAARDWSQAFFTALQGYGIAATGAFSMELGNGDPSVAAGIAQRYPSGNAVMVSTPALQTNFSPASTAFWQQAYLDLATLMANAGQTPYLQFGEVQWWYFPDDGSGMPYYDAYTTSTFQQTYGRALPVFTTTNVNVAQYPQETAFLSGLIGTFTTAIMNFVRQTYPNAEFEVLYPPDTNDSPLDTAVNLPASWNAATLNCFKTENFTFTGNRNLDQAEGSIVLPMQMGFPRSQSAHLVGITGYSTPWEKEALLTLAQNVESMVLFALDQFCLMNCTDPLPVGNRRALFMGRDKRLTAETRRRREIAGSVERGWGLGIAQTVKYKSDLLGQDPGEGQRGNPIFRKEADVDGFRAGSCAAAKQLTAKHQLVCVDGNRRMRMFVPVPAGEQLHGSHNIAGLLAHFALHGFGGTLPDLSPSTGQRPATVSPLADQKQAICVKHRSTHVHSGCGVPLLGGE